MKYRVSIKTLILSAMLGVSALVTSCDDDDDDVIQADALFRPIVKESVASGQWIELNWDRYKGAEYFVLTLSGKAKGQADSTKIEVQTDTTFYRFEGLEYDTDYYIKIKSVGSNLESKYYNVPVITTSDYPTQLNSVRTVDIQALVSWNEEDYDVLNLVQVVTPEGSTVSEEVEVLNYEVSPEENESKEVIFNNLEPSSNYIVRAYSKGVYQGKKVFSTSAEELFEGKVVDLRGLPEEEAYGVLTSSFFADTIASNPDQNITIILEGGMKYEMASLKLPATTGVIKMVTGLSLRGNAVLEVSGNYDIEGYVGGFVAEKITFLDHPSKPRTDSNFGGTYLFNLSVAGSEIGSIEFINSEIKYKRGVCRVKTGAKIGKYVVNNCVVDSIGGYGIINMDNGDAALEDIEIVNSTFSHCEKLLVCTKPTSKTINSLDVKNCTFVYNMKGGNNYLFDFNGFTIVSSAVVKNCIFGPGGNNGEASAISGARSATAITFDKCYSTSDCEWFTAEGATAPTAPIDATSTGADVKGTFKDVTNNDFTLLINDLKEYGDPRWW